MATENLEATRPIVTPAGKPCSLTVLAADLARALADREALDDDVAIEAQERAWATARAMAERPATTIADLNAKARAVAFALENEVKGEGSDMRLLRSMLADIEALAR